MKKIIIILPFFIALAFAKININEAGKSELIKYGKFDSKSADRVIEYREKKNISSAVELKNILNLQQNTQNFEQIFIFDKPSKKRVIKKVITPYSSSSPVIIEKTINTPYGQKKILKYGDITTIETNHYPYYKKCKDKDCKIIRKNNRHHYKKYKDSDFEDNNIELNGEIKIKIDKKL